MPELWRKNLALHDAVLVAVYWSIVFLIPFMIADRNVRLRALGWIMVAGLIGYCTYTVMVTLRHGNKARFILRMVIPVGLFVMGWIVVTLRG